MGGANVTAQLHYDESHNLFAQIYGRKRFVLLPPESHRHISLYPHLHPSQRSVRISTKSSYLSLGIPFYEVTLAPGDLLYLPPLWFHHVTALEDSISVNVWSESKGNFQSNSFTNN